MTEPEAIEYVMSLNNATCRVYAADEVLQRRLQPINAFHPKVYLFGNKDTLSSATKLSALVGSCNLTKSALLSNVEAYCVVEANHANELGNLVLEMERLYASAQDVDNSWLKRYSKIRKSFSPPADPPTVPPPRGEMGSESDRALRGATYFWTQTRKISHNRGTQLPGSQVDLRKGVRVFFGSSVPLNAAENTDLATVRTRINNSAPIDRELRYNDNGMDVINLPLPEDHDIDSYENCYLVWRRNSDNTFTLTVQETEGDLLSRSNRTGAVIPYAGGRRLWGYYT